MRTITKLAGSLSIFLFFLSSSTAHGFLFPRVVDDVNLDEFLGKWYQVASTNPAFQEDCVCVTAEYELNADDNVDVINTCVKGDPLGPLEQVIGEARTTRNPAKLNVAFGGFRLPFSNYWVVDLADDYSYAVISTPFRNPVWILSRTPELEADILDDIYDDLDRRWFPVNDIQPTLQAGCNN